MSEQCVSDAFRQVAAQCQEAVDKTQSYDDFKPPGSPSGIIYSCQFVDLATGASTKDDETNAWIRTSWMILDGDYAGRKFDAIFSSKFAWALGPVFTLAAMVDNNPAIMENRNLVETAEALERHVGKPIVNVISKTTKSKKNGQEYTNISFDKVTDVVAEAA